MGIKRIHIFAYFLYFCCQNAWWNSVIYFLGGRGGDLMRIITGGVIKVNIFVKGYFFGANLCGEIILIIFERPIL